MRVALGALVAGALAGQVAGAAGFVLASPAFKSQGRIPVEYTCDGRNVSPPLRWTTPPAGTRAFALLMDDPDAPGRTFTHWIAWNIPASTRSLAAGARPLLEGTNDAGRVGYVGPCPPSGVHRYVFHLYALRAPLRLARGASRADFLAAVRDRVLAAARLVGRYGR